MTKARNGLILGTVLLGFAGLAQAQSAASGAADTPVSHSTPQSEAGEPRATTSPDGPAAADRGPAAPAADAGSGAPAGAHDAQAPAPHAARPERRGGGGGEKDRKPAGVDTLELKTATVTGDREQPKVMYIVPWKRSDIGDLSGKPMNSLLDEALAPIDRDEFKREVMYYQTIRADAPQNGASKAH